MDTALLTRGLSRRVSRDFAVADVSMTVPAGAIYGLLGPNGAGKTTTLRLVLDLLRPDRGQVEVLGVDARRHPARARMRVGYVPERPAIPEWMTIERAMRHHAAFHPTWDWTYAGELRSRLQLPPARRVQHLSKGEAGKLALVLALAHRPALLVLDEPTDGLDPVARREIVELLLEYVSDSAATVVISSHLVHELERFADRVGVMDHGRLVAETPLEALRGSIKRLRVQAAPGTLGPLPFTLLSREPHGREEVWAVRGWEPEMGGELAARGVAVHGVMDLDLEECYVALLRTPAPEDVHAG
jgi:ABC-type multidrug transport system ATPase subunit